MKTYFLDIIKRIKRFSEKFNVSTTLCDKTWVVFNDTGEREVYIFQPDGSVFITSDGIGIKGKWHWVPVNESLIINKDDNVLMFHPEFIDNTILALTLDGTNKMAFLIEQGNQNAFAAKNLSQLEKYFEIKEQELIQAENDQIEKEMLQAFEDDRIVEDEEEAKRHEEWFKDNEIRLKKEAEQISKDLTPSWFRIFDWIAIRFCFVSGPLAMLFLGSKGFFQNIIHSFLDFAMVFFLLFIICIIIGFIMISLVSKKAEKQFEKNFLKWRKTHPNDERTPYIEF